MPVGDPIRYRLRRNRLAFDAFSTRNRSNCFACCRDETLAQQCDETVDCGAAVRSDSTGQPAGIAELANVNPEFPDFFQFTAVPIRPSPEQHETIGQPACA